MFGRMLQNSGALLPNEVFDLTDELFLRSLLSKCNILTHEPDRLREGGTPIQHPYQLLLVLVGMFCGWIRLHSRLARCQHDLWRSESLSHIA